MGIGQCVTLVLLFSCVWCATAASVKRANLNSSGSSNDTSVSEESRQDLIEQGRTIVHHAMKRFMVILPAVFFKLGVAFSLLVLITLVAVNNGFIGFLLLVVGVSSVLARMQESRRPNVVPLLSPITAPYHPAHHHVWDRSDRSDSDTMKLDATKQLAYTGYDNYGVQSQFSQINTPSSYYANVNG